MVKKVDDMTIVEYIEYEERIKRQYSKNYGSYFPTYFGHCTSSNNTTLEFPHNTYFNPITPNIKFNYDSKDMDLDEEAGYTTDKESVMSEHEAIKPDHTVNTQSFKEELSSEEDLDESLNAKIEKHMSAFMHSWKLVSWGEPHLSAEMDDMTQQETLGTMKNVLVKINKFEFPCDFVVTKMPKNLGEMIVLGRPFLETIHAQIDVFQEEISLGIGEDRIKFDINGNPFQANITIENIYMANTSQEEESFNPLEIGQDLFLYESPTCLKFEQDTRNYDTIDPHNEIAEQTNPILDKGGLTKRWYVCKPVQVFYDNRSGEDCGMWPTYDRDSSFCYGYKEVPAIMRQLSRPTPPVSCGSFADLAAVLIQLQRKPYYGYAKPSRDFTRPLGPPVGLKCLLHMLNAIVIPTKVI
ncbi:hypothetical protein Tco_0876738 [Tanacetum coccineum]|uniref:Reverse transcriptase domain-containing protein n=1 Tax=Tanacetum coccineum TaxID=301880 RepID=A0ABQ5BW27_9ASTR